MTSFAPLERAALADLLAEVGPDAPTLCTGWTARDLAAHLIVRATRPDAAAGIAIPRLAGHTKRVQDRVATRDWADLVAGVRRRPLWIAPVDEVINRVEYFIHHEDVRRARPGWQPRRLGAEFNAALWSRVRTQARLVLRRTPATVLVTAPGHGTITAGRRWSRISRGGSRSEGRGSRTDRLPEIDLVGEPGELLLFLSGRQAHARVDLAGPEAITGRMRGARYGV